MTTRITTLPSGVRVVPDVMDTVGTATIGVWVGAGTRHEDAGLNGVSHLLEHMAFKGTRRRTARAIAEEIEAVGGYLNAYTTREYTAYYAKVLSEDTGLAIDLIADILQHSTLEPSELERERTVILQEIGEAHDTPDDIIFDYFQEAAYPDQAIGRPVLGSPELIRSLPRAAILDYMRAHYGASGVIVAAAGRIEHDRIVALAEKSFDALPAAPAAAAFQPAAYRGGMTRHPRELEQAHLVLGFDGISALDEDFHAASVFSTLFGGGMSSRLFQEVRESRGLAYSIYSFLSCYADGGLFGVYAGVSETDAGQALDVIAEQTAAVAEGVTEGEIARARTQIKASTLMALESTTARCEQAARYLMLYGRAVPFEEIVAKIDAVDLAAVRRVAHRLTASAPTLALLGPIDRVGDYERLTARLGR